MIATELTQKPAEYSFPIMRLITHDVPAQSTGVITRTIASGVLPNLLIVGITKGNQGETLKENPFYFNPRDLQRIFFTVNGRLINTDMGSFDLSQKNYTGMYYNMMETLGLNEQRQFVNISKEAYSSGLFFIPLDLFWKSLNLYIML